MTPRRACLLTAAAVAALAIVPAADAFYGEGATIVSASLERQEQADDTSVSVDLSADGRYVAFHTRARNFFADDDPDPPGQFRAGGVFRRDLQTGALELVAGGDIRDEVSTDLVARGAAAPSISADGRYVAFQTGAALDASDLNEQTDIYVRDMSVGRDQPAAYELASALNGPLGAPTYATPAEPRPRIDVGSDSARAVSISADGRRVLFRAVAASNLPGGGPGTLGGERNLFVRDLNAETTTLVTRAAVGGGPVGGAGPGALSADGSTVAWPGQNAPAQATFLNGEGPSSEAYFFLWRRVADGPDAPTRRITGIADPEDPACPPGSSIVPSGQAVGPCYGPLTEPEDQFGSDISTITPALDATGRKVAFLTGAGPRPNTLTPPNLDLWITDMSPGVTRKAGSVELTREGGSGNPVNGSAIENVTASPDGRYLALTTYRTQFVLPALVLTGTRRAIPNAREIYMVDLATRRAERVLRSSAGGDTNGDADAFTSISAGGTRIAFISAATNLFFGDANSRADAFTVTRQPEPAPEPPEAPGTGAGGGGAIIENDPGDRTRRRLSVAVTRARGARIVLRVRATGPGTARARARARIAKKTRVIAKASRAARRAGPVRLTLKPSRAALAVLRRSGRLPARVTVTFDPKRGRTVKRVLRVSFRIKLPQKGGTR